MWILKTIIGCFCILFCLVGVIWIIPATIMWNSKPIDAYYTGVWEVYEKYFEKK